MKIRTFCFAAAFGATIFACSGKNSDVSDSTDNSSEDLVTAVCSKAACGPALGMPAEICPDGSIGGNTGRCIETKGNPVCHWEIRKCPPTPTVCDCGPINFLVAACPDGTVRKPICEPLPEPVASSGGGTGTAGGGTASGGGSTGGAKPPAPAPDPGGTPVPGPGPTPGPGTGCGWVIPPCPTPPPPKCDCGPAPALAKVCPDGSTSKTVCVDNDPKSASPVACHWEIECPPTPTPVDCSAKGACPGPEPLSPTYLCADGKTTAGPTCVDEGGKCGWEITSCPVCDPVGAPPKPGCSWDSKACAWLCL